MQTRTARTLLCLGLICLATVLTPQRIGSSARAAAAADQQPATETRQPEAPRRVLPGQSITRLPDGRWLALGGMRGTRPVASIAVVNPDTGETLSGGVSLSIPRAGHTATVLPDGTVLVVGGVGPSGEAVAVAERFDPSTNTVAAAAVSGLLPRAGHSATLLTDGRVLIAGGVSASGDLLQGAELFDPRTGRAEQVPLGIGTPRRDHVAELGPDGTVVVRGGSGVVGPVEQSEHYDPLTTRFMPYEPRQDGSETTYVAESVPQSGDRDVPVGTIIAVRFSRVIDVRSVSPQSVRLAGPEGAVAAAVVAAEGGRLVFITPRPPLAAGTDYVLSIEDVRGMSGEVVPATDIVWSTRREKDAPKPVPAEPDDAIARDAQGRPRSPWMDLAPLLAEPAATAVSGRVLRLNGQPLADVTLEMEGQEVRTDRTGRFLLRIAETATTEWRELFIDGRSASTKGRTYGTFEVGLTVAAGRMTVLPYTIWMPALDTAHAVTIPSPTTAEVVVTTPRIPGLELRLPPGTVIRDRDRKVVRELTITPIPLDQPPFPLPTDLEVPLYFTIQPGGAYVRVSGINVPPGARLVYPNRNGYPTGRRMAFWRYDPNGRGWHVYGQGAVTGPSIAPDPGVAIYEFTGAMVADPNFGPPEGPALGSEDNDRDDPVDAGTGLFVMSKTDLALPDVLPIELTRVYRPRDSRSRAFGVGTTHPYEMFIVGMLRPWNYAEVVLPDGGRLAFPRISSGADFDDAVFEHTGTPTRFYKARIAWNEYGWDLTLKDGTVYTFPDAEAVSTPARAAIVGIRDRFGNQIGLTRDANGNLKQITAPHGRWIRLTYDTVNRVTQAQDNTGRTVQYTYDTVGRLWKVTDAANGVTEYTYDTQHRMLTIKDPRNIVYLTNEYDSAGRVIRQAHADGTESRWAYTLSPAGFIEQVDYTNRRGVVERMTLNASGYTLMDTEALGTPEERTTTYERQASGQLPTKITDGLGRKTTFTYDASGNVTSVTVLAETAEAATTAVTYEPRFQQVASVTDPLSHASTFTYDARGALSRTTDALGRQTHTATDGAGRPLTMTDAAGQVTSLTYALSDLVSITDPLGRSTQHVVDTAGRATLTVDPLGNPTTSVYDAFNQVTQVTDALSGVTAFSYDPNGNLLTLTDARTNTTAFTYDAMDRVASRTDGLNRTETFLYDGSGNLRQVTDRKSQVTTYTYDPLDRLKTATYADGSTTTYTYDAGDRVTQIVDSLAGTITRTYSGRDQLLTETTPLGTVTYTYDAADRRTSMTIAGQPTVIYTYNDVDQLTGLTRGPLGVAMAYDRVGRTTSLTLPNGVVATSIYDAASQLRSRTFALGSTELGSLTYTYDAAGRRTSVGGTWARTGLPAALGSATYDAANQIVTFGGVPHTYDANGNLTSDGVRGYTWDARNRLVGLSGAVPATFAYDAVDRRVEKTINGQTTAFLYDGLNGVQELVAGAPVANLLSGLGLDEWFARSDASGTTNLLGDALGSTVGLADAAGGVRTQYSYEPFGATTVSGSASANTAQFTGRENDGTGLYHYRARYYSPALQRFVNEDPMGFGGGDVNLHAYTFNSPTNLIDPTGNAVIRLPPWAVPASCRSLQGRQSPSWWDRFWCDVELGSMLPTPGAIFGNIHRHHPWPKYLGGHVKQILEHLPDWLHKAYHRGLDDIAPRWRGTSYYDNLSTAAYQQMLQDLATYTKAFDAKYGTRLFDAMRRNGFPF